MLDHLDIARFRGQLAHDLGTPAAGKQCGVRFMNSRSPAIPGRWRSLT
jgi:hypothetical protein